MDFYDNCYSGVFRCPVCLPTQGYVTLTRGPGEGGRLHCIIGNAYLREGVNQGLVTVSGGRVPPKHLSGLSESHPKTTGGIQSSRIPKWDLFCGTNSNPAGRGTRSALPSGLEFHLRD